MNKARGEQLLEQPLLHTRPQRGMAQVRKGPGGGGGRGQECQDRPAECGGVGGTRIERQVVFSLTKIRTHTHMPTHTHTHTQAHTRTRGYTHTHAPAAPGAPPAAAGPTPGSGPAPRGRPPACP